MNYKQRYFDFADDTNEELTPETSMRISNIFYLTFFTLFGILSFIIFNNGEKWIGKIALHKYESKHMIRLSSVVRTTCPLAIWFLLHSLMTIGYSNVDEDDHFQFKFHTSYLWLHALIYFIIAGAFWFIPDPFYKVYLDFSIYASGVYLVIQIFFLIDFFKILNDKLVDVNKLWVVGLLTTVLSLGTIVAFGLSFYFFAVNGCQQNNIYISVNMSLCIALFIISIFVPHGSIFTSSLVSAYVAYLTISGMICLSNCSRLSFTKKSDIGLSISASVITLVWAGYSAFTSTNQIDSCSLTEDTDNGSKNQFSLYNENIISSSSSRGKRFSLSFFHFMFMLASIYITMVVSHWGKEDVSSSEEYDDTQWTVGKGTIARWVNFSSSWMVIVLYSWSLAAPYVFKNRYFD